MTIQPDGKAGSNDWRSRLRRIHDEAFNRDWDQHLLELNARLGLTGDDTLFPSVAGHPPVWFNGDVEVIEPGNWVLVLSLNYQLAGPDAYGSAFTPESFWQLWRSHNRQYWYARFFRPLVQVASLALGKSIPSEAEP